MIVDMISNKKLPNKQEVQKVASSDSSDIDFKDFMNLYKKCTAKTYSKTYSFY